MKRKTLIISVAVTFALAMFGCEQKPAPAKPGAKSSSAQSGPDEEAAEGWLHWRGPQQNGVSLETHLPDKWELDGANHLWTMELPGRGTPVVSGDRMIALGYRGDGPDLQEVLISADAVTGEVEWERTFNDFISDVIYSRYSIGAPTVDAQSGNIYVLTTPGLLVCYSAEGKQLWKHSMMEDFGRLTFPNGRTGAPSIDGELVIVHVISANWGAEGPAMDRFYAFDKRTGEPVWSSTPGVGAPFLKDSSFSSPVFEWRNGKRVFYCGTGCGNIVGVNALTGEPLWRYQLSVGGVNSTVLIHKDTLIAVHGAENIDSSKVGRMIALDLNAKPVKGEDGTMQLPSEAELWRNDDLDAFTSSPVLVGDVVYQVNATGILYAIDANTGHELWQKKLGTDQIHASATYADGKLYVPMNEGKFYILKPTDSGAQVLSMTELDGNCLGAPAIWNGKIYVFTNKHLYAFGSKEDSDYTPDPLEPQKAPAPGEAVALQIIPSEVLLSPSENAAFRIRNIDANGLVVANVDTEDVEWEKYIPPTAKVRAEMDADFDQDGDLVAGSDAKASAGAFKATSGKLSGTIRGRILPNIPYNEDFEGFDLVETHAGDGAKFAYPPLPWIGGRFKWEIREHDGSKVFAKTLDRLLFMRATTFIGKSDLTNYTLEADVMTDGNRRSKGDVGLINQRYMIVLKGNHQEIEIASNQERIKYGIRFPFEAKVWYRLKTRVDVAKDGSGVVRGKVWKKSEPEPEQWTIEFKHNHAHTEGSPAIYGFSPQNTVRVYVDNIAITPN